MMSESNHSAYGSVRFWMKRTAVAALLLLSMLLWGCGSVDEGRSSQDGILIIPGTSPTVCSTAKTDTDSIAQTTSLPEDSGEDTVAVTGEGSVPLDIDSADTDIYMEQAERLLLDESFAALLSKAGGDPKAALPYITALLCYMDLHGEGTRIPEDTDADGMTVYWTAGGSVWHEEKSCSALANSKNILSGSVNEARLAGKNRGCKRCTDGG